MSEYNARESLSGFSGEIAPKANSVVFRHNESGQLTIGHYSGPVGLQEYLASKMLDGSNRTVGEVFSVVAEGISAESAQKIVRPGEDFKRVNDAYHAALLKAQIDGVLARFQAAFLGFKL